MGSLCKMIKYKKVMGLLLIHLLIFFPLIAGAQNFSSIRENCIPDDAESYSEARSTVGVGKRRLPSPNKDWDASKIYKQLVILISFADTPFQREDPLTDYQKIFNEPGYNEGYGPGCVADYYCDQSAGRFNMSFDVFGPYQVSIKAQPYTNPNSSTRNYGTTAMREATQMMIAEHPDWDFSVYDWNGDGRVNQVIYVCAGWSGNQGGGYVGGVYKSSDGYVWPNTSSFTAIDAPGGMKISSYSLSAELWLNDRSSGIGTICHEFSHSLGLPDIYPVGGNSTSFSVVDEWDLMDGGNFTNYGWCPPNFTALEKMLMGWSSPVELSEPQSVLNMKSVSDGGNIYQIKHTNSEYYLLENRQQKGWDLGLPGSGLLITHVDYDEQRWMENKVNGDKDHPLYAIVHADNMDYDVWETAIAKAGLSKYANPQHMNRRYLSTSAYPWQPDTDTVNDSLTNHSVPASVMYQSNDDESTLLSKSIAAIRMSDNGLISFNFMGGSTSGIHEIQKDVTADSYYDLLGRSISNPVKPGLYIFQGKKIVKH